MRARFIALFALFIGATLLTAACGSTTPAPSALSSIAITGAAPVVGGQSQFTATGTLSDGTTKDLTSSASWTSSDTTIATVSTTGVVTGVAAGTASVFATVGAVSGSLPVVVN